MRRTTVGFVLAAALVACSRDASTSPNLQRETLTTPGDTGRAPMIGFSDVSGRVYSKGVPVAAAVVKLYHNVLVDGQGVSQYVTEVTAGADGSFAFKAVPFGYYLLRSGTTGLSYLAANAETVRLDVWLQ